MTSIDSITLEVTDLARAQAFYDAAFGLEGHVRLRASTAPTTGFRGYTISLMVSQPADVRALVDAAVAAGATALKPAKKSLWGYGGVLQAPDGTIWQVATSNKRDSGPATGRYNDMVLLLGVTDMAASKHFYVDQGLTVARSFGRKYVEFDLAEGPIKLALYGRRALAKVAGVPADGTGSHRLAIGTDAGSFCDPDGFGWEASSAHDTPPRSVHSAGHAQVGTTPSG
jgi:catechol 2,3-dioxygenase-like lactoylglutathione lyase family enzyme